MREYYCLVGVGDLCVSYPLLPLLLLLLAAMENICVQLRVYHGFVGADDQCPPYLCLPLLLLTAVMENI